MKKIALKDIKKVLADRDRYYCHITRKENVQSIFKNGLRANKDGEIFVYDDVMLQQIGAGEPYYIGDSIAINQLGINDEKYAVFFIDKKDIKGEVISDNVAEFAAPWQHIIKQKKIEPFFFSYNTNEMLHPNEEV